MVKDFTMHIGWRQYLKQKFRRVPKHHVLGVSVDAESVSFCIVKREQDSIVLVDEETVTPEKWGEKLHTWLKEKNLLGISTCVCMSHSWYNALQLDRPNVEDNEVHGALQWSVAEILGSDKAYVFDYVDLPVPLAGTNKVNVFALPRSVIADVVSHIQFADVTLKEITTAELALCELMPSMESATVLLTQEAGEEVVLNVVKDGNLYSSRRLKGFENIGSFSQEELEMGLLDNLGVQIQRSMDHFESQLRQPPIRSVLFRLDSPHSTTLKMQLSQLIPAQIDQLISPIQVSEDIDVYRLNLVSLSAAFCALVPQPIAPPTMSTTGELK